MNTCKFNRFLKPSMYFGPFSHLVCDRSLDVVQAVLFFAYLFLLPIGVIFTIQVASCAEGASQAAVQDSDIQDYLHRNIVRNFLNVLDHRKNMIHPDSIVSFNVYPNGSVREAKLDYKGILNFMRDGTYPGKRTESTGDLKSLRESLKNLPPFDVMPKRIQSGLLCLKVEMRKDDDFSHTVSFKPERELSAKADEKTTFRIYHLGHIE